MQCYGVSLNLHSDNSRVALDFQKYESLLYCSCSDLHFIPNLGVERIRFDDEIGFCLAMNFEVIRFYH